MKKKIIITGSSGFIGTHLSRYLSKHYEIIGIDRERGEYTTHNQDINLQELPNIDNIYAVIHLAARAGVRESKDNFEEYVNDNILATKRVLDKCVDWKPKRILVASSSSIYGDSIYHLSDEYRPKSLYAMTKVATEKIVNTYQQSYLPKDTQTCNMRIFTVYGPRQRDGLAMGNFITNILQEKPITVYGDGNQTRDFTYIKDLCIGIGNLLESEELPQETDIGNGNEIKINEIIYLLSQLIDKKVTIDYKPMMPEDVLRTKSSKNPYIISPPTDLAFGLKNQIDAKKKELGT